MVEGGQGRQHQARLIIRLIRFRPRSPYDLGPLHRLFPRERIERFRRSAAHVVTHRGVLFREGGQRKRLVELALEPGKDGRGYALGRDHTRPRDLFIARHRLGDRGQLRITGERLSVVTANPRSRPDFTCGSSGPMLLNVICTWPDATSVITCSAALYGM